MIRRNHLLLFLGCLFITLIFFQIPGSAQLPQPDSNGDYSRRDIHLYWEVVDPDPAGLNCRMERGCTFLDISGADETCHSFYRNPFQVDVIGALKAGEQFKSYPSNVGGVFRDNNNAPWLFVGENYSGGVSGCFVRANRDFVKPINAPNIKQDTALPMTITFVEETADILVPDRNTTVSAYGGELRLYDVHIAKMFEVTKFLCDRGFTGGILWNYRAGGGSIRMGAFNVTCAEANHIASIFGRGKPEITNILYIGEEGYRRQETFDIPILNIVGDKIPQWLDFVETLSPVR